MSISEQVRDALASGPMSASAIEVETGLGRTQVINALARLRSSGAVLIAPKTALRGRHGLGQLSRRWVLAGGAS